jgi:DNA-binding transcriptional MerR regulator
VFRAITRQRNEEAALNKAPEAYRTISEVAEELNLPQHVLRFWETRFPHIKPMKRGGGRRFYRPEDVDLLRGIRHLLYGDGYTIRGVQRILREQGVRAVQSVGQGREVALPPRSPHDELEPDGDVEPAEAAPEANGAAVERAASRAVPPPKPINGASAPAKPASPHAQVSAAKSLANGDLERLRGALASLEEARRLLGKVD